MLRQNAEATAIVRMNAEEACVALGVSSRTLYTRAKLGEIDKHGADYSIPLSTEVRQRIAEFAARCNVDCRSDAAFSAPAAVNAETVATEYKRRLDSLEAEIERLHEVESQLIERICARDEEVQKLQDNAENAEIRKDTLVAQAQKLLADTQQRLDKANEQLLAIKPVAESAQEMQQKLLQTQQEVQVLTASRPRGFWAHVRSWWNE